jgi:hypothetical protein
MPCLHFLVAQTRSSHHVKRALADNAFPDQHTIRHLLPLTLHLECMWVSHEPELRTV